MADNNVKAEDIFGVVSDFHGAWGSGEKKKESVPVSAKGRAPQWHDSAFNGTEVETEAVTEEELCSHF